MSIDPFRLRQTLVAHLHALSPTTIHKVAHIADKEKEKYQELVFETIVETMKDMKIIERMNAMWVIDAICRSERNAVKKVQNIITRSIDHTW